MNGSVFRLDCGVRGGGLHITVYWFKGQVEVVSGSGGFEIRTLSNGTSSLICSAASVRDNGSEYSCKAVSDGVALTQQFNIFITSE